MTRNKKHDSNSIERYDFHLPEELIAQEPAAHRDGSRLMVVNRHSKTISCDIFSNIISELPDKCLLVANNSRVLPARIRGQRPSGGAVEFLLLTPLPLIMAQVTGSGFQEAEVQGLVRSSKRLGPGQTARFGDLMEMEILERQEFGRCRVRLRYTGDLKSLFESCGHMPLPPYIKRNEEQADRNRYQTTYAREEKTGSVAAPTAGLHFTPALKDRLLEQGHEWAEVTLYVGYGTFSPVRVNDIRDHRMHGEFVEMGEDTAARIRRAKQEGRPVVAVGTTTVRSLEGAFAACSGLEPFSGWTDIYIRPGFAFQVVDAMITNFHLPKSSLLIMISAFAGNELVREAYRRAVQEQFRFFSYGDSMLIL